MRALLVAAVLGLPLTASAGPFYDRIMQPPRHAPPGTAAFTNVSHTIYLNPCMPNGCTVSPGFDDSRTDHSSIPNNPATLTAFPHGSQSWNTLVQCVKAMYAPFNVTVTDVDPGSTPHYEVMIAGTSSAIGVGGAGGVAPFVPCDGQLEDNVISFVFAAQTSNQDFLCWAAAQESAHVFGLDHELNAMDPMTYLTPPTKKPGFQNVSASCGEDTPRQCFCGGTQQNSYQYLMDTFGPSNLAPGTIAITEPKEGEWVKPGFKVKFDVMSQLSVVKGELKIDGMTAQTIEQGAENSFTAPTTLPGGDHVVMVAATDSSLRMLTNQVTVHVTARCDTAACADGFSCLGGYCLPGADVAGGLGSTCTNNDQCITETCGTDGTNMLCTGACDTGYKCPDGFTCLAASGTSGVCWPGEEDTGCCSTSTKNSPLHALLGLGVLALVIRRKRR